MPIIDLPQKTSKPKIMKKCVFKTDRLFMNYLNKIMEKYLKDDPSYTWNNYGRWAIKVKTNLELNSLNEAEVIGEFISIRENRRLNETLVKACAESNMHLIKECIDKGANVNYVMEIRSGINLYRSVLFNGEKNNSDEVLKFMLGNYDLSLSFTFARQTQLINLDNRVFLNCINKEEISRISRYYKSFDLFEKHLFEYRKLRPEILTEEDVEKFLKVQIIMIGLQ